MVTEAQIQEIVQRIVAGYQPDRLILFGSYAYGTPTEDSDLDLLVIKADDARSQLDRLRTIGRWLFYRSGAPALDILVLNGRETRQALQNRFAIEFLAVRNGRALYDATT